MSRIGKLPVQVPEGVSIDLKSGNIVHVKGPKGELEEKIHPDIKVSLEEGQVVFERPTEQKKHKSMHGLYRSLVFNMVVGVSEGYKKTMELIGVGYRADVKNNNILELNLGYSHNIYFKVPDEIKVTTETVKGQNPKVHLESTDKQLIGHVAAKIKSLRPVEPYKGKGVRFAGEYVRRKAGKAAAK